MLLYMAYMDPMGYGFVHTWGTLAMARVPRENHDSPVELRLCSDKPMYKNIETKQSQPTLTGSMTFTKKKSRSPVTRTTSCFHDLHGLV